jgi:hypothetical protein
VFFHFISTARQGSTKKFPLGQVGRQKSTPDIAFEFSLTDDSLSVPAKSARNLREKDKDKSNELSQSVPTTQMTGPKAVDKDREKSERNDKFADVAELSIEVSIEKEDERQIFDLIQTFGMDAEIQFYQKVTNQKRFSFLVSSSLPDRSQVIEKLMERGNYLSALEILEDSSLPIDPNQNFDHLYKILIEKSTDNTEKIPFYILRLKNKMAAATLALKYFTDWPIDIAL